MLGFIFKNCAWEENLRKHYNSTLLSFDLLQHRTCAIKPRLVEMQQERQTNSEHKFNRKKTCKPLALASNKTCGEREAGTKQNRVIAARSCPPPADSTDVVGQFLWLSAAKCVRLLNSKVPHTVTHALAIRMTILRTNVFPVRQIRSSQDINFVKRVRKQVPSAESL